MSQYSPYTCHGHEPFAHDCYPHGCCPPPPKPPYPSDGPITGNGLMLIETKPYLYDTSVLTYGNFLSVSENVNTRISQRRDISGINLAATFDLTENLIKNTVLLDYAKQQISNHYVELDGILPILKSELTFVLHYHIVDDLGGTVYENTVTAKTDYMKLHRTDVQDVLLTSTRSIFSTNIPAMDYEGMYNIILDKIEVYLNMIDTASHIQEGLNPYYQFTKNNTKLVLQHEAINVQEPDESIHLVTGYINKAFPFQSNVTTRFKMSFTAFMSDLIIAPDAYDIWQCLYEPTDAILDNLTQTVKTLQESLTTLSTEFTNYKTTTDARLTALEQRVTVLEERPLALRRYVEGESYVTSQITWTTYGKLYQVAKNFTACGDMVTDIANGNIVPLVIDGDMELEALTESINTVESNLSALSEKVTTDEFDIGNLKYKTDQMKESIETNEGSITELTTLTGTHTSQIEGLDQRVSSLENV